MTNVQRGEIWLIDLDPTRGQDIQQTQPAVIISFNTLGTIASKLIEATEWREQIVQLLKFKGT